MTPPPGEILLINLQVTEIDITWWSAQHDFRGLMVYAELVHPLAAKDSIHFKLSYPILNQPIKLKFPSSVLASLTAQELAELTMFVESTSDQARELTRAFFEERPFRSRLAHVPLRLVQISFGRTYNADVASLPALSKAYLPMEAHLLNQPGQPVGGLWLSFAAANGELVSVFDGSLQDRRRSRGGPHPLAGLSQDEMDAGAAAHYFGLRYGSVQAAELMADLTSLGHDGRKLGLALVETLS